MLSEQRVAASCPSRLAVSTTFPALLPCQGQLPAPNFPSSVPFFHPSKLPVRSNILILEGAGNASSHHPNLETTEPHTIFGASSRASRQGWRCSDIRRTRKVPASVLPALPSSGAAPVGCMHTSPTASVAPMRKPSVVHQQPMCALQHMQHPMIFRRWLSAEMRAKNGCLRRANPAGISSSSPRCR